MDVPHDWSVELTPVHSAGVNDPALWSVDTPTLYHVRTDIVSDDSVVDITTTGLASATPHLTRIPGSASTANT